MTVHRTLLETYTFIYVFVYAILHISGEISLQHHSNKFLFQIYFHRRQMRHGQEGVELGSDAEVKWAAHLLQISDEYLHKTLTTRVTETRSERLFTPLGIDQALDSRDAFAKVLYAGLFNW